MELRKTARNALKFGSLHLLFIAVCFIALVPIIYALAISFSGTTNLTGGVFAITDFTFDNYLHIFTELDFGTWLGNSLILSLSTVLVTVIPSAAIGMTGERKFEQALYNGHSILIPK